ncbi:hypothetical protein ANN_18190 [Periplaneta americana]|uniref:Gustatory receptor n=1 Tax=Periplaneta americana TaxID=6978 RepID=A0ABQ8SP18_PERAM|nr:hypothetical protein ANN_18190 [Periplaneta americana]
METLNPLVNKICDSRIKGTGVDQAVSPLPAAPDLRSVMESILVWVDYLLLFITVFCHLTAEEVKKTPCIVRKIILEPYFEKSVAKELLLLSSQLKDMKMIISGLVFVTWNRYRIPFLMIGEIFCKAGVCVIATKYIILVQYCYQKHKDLNYDIKSLTGITKTEIQIQELDQYNEHICDIVGTTEQNLPTCNGLPSTGIANVQRIRKLEEYYIDLYELIQMINSTYGYQILLCILHTFINQITYYNYLIDLITSDLSEAESMGTKNQETLAVIFGILSSVTFLIITVSCHLTSKESDKLLLFLHKLLLIQHFNSEITGQVQMFISQVSDLKVKFTSCGLFRIDMVLFYSFIGVISTYLIIFYQFR